MAQSRKIPRSGRLVRSLGAAAVVAALAPMGGALTPAAAAAPENPAPAVYPSLHEWHGGQGDWRFTPATRIVVDQRDQQRLGQTASMFADDLAAETGHRPAVVTGDARPGDVVLTAHTTDTGLGTEGYRMTVDNILNLEAPTDTGVFYGTQTVEQILKTDPHRSRVPQGTARDWPNFGERAQMLDVGRKYYPMDYLKSQIRTMAWEKLNTFHLHLSDWEGFRIQTQRFPGLASAQSYSKADLRELQDYAKQYHVMIIPEVDLPAHADAIAQYDPTLRFSCHSLDYSHWPGAEQGGWVLNIASEHTRQFVHDLLDEIIPMFDSPYFHVGGDEYPYDADKAACPELVAYQQARGFAYPGDVFTDFFNTLNAQVRSFGKTTEMWEWWNFNHQQTSIQPDKNIVVDSWVNNDPAGLAAQGYNVVGTPEMKLYVSAGFGQKIGDYGYFNVQDVYENYAFSHPAGILGYRVSRWSDRAEQQSPEWLDFFARRPLQVLAERLWGGPTSPTVWQYFARVDSIGGPPPSELTAVPSAQAKVVGVDSQDSSAVAANVLDNNPYTIWQTASTANALPHEITVDLGREYPLAGFRYLPRQDGSTAGRVGQYEFSVSDDGTDWHSVASGTFVNDQTEKEVQFGESKARFVRLRALSEVNGASTTSMAELTVLQAPAANVH